MSKQILIQDITTNNETPYELKNDNFTWQELITVIKTYQQSVDQKDILIQVKINEDPWKYIYQEFSIQTQKIQQLKVRYKNYNYKLVNQYQQEINHIGKEVNECVIMLQECKKINTNVTEIDLLWAAPFEKQAINYKSDDKTTKEKQDNLIGWKIKTNGYIKEIGDIIQKSKKKVLLNINNFNSESFKYKIQYEIVYIVCHTEYEIVEQNKIKYYFVGDFNGVMNKIYTNDLFVMLQNKTINLLILYTSFSNQHLKEIKQNDKIKNILVINSNPLFRQEIVQKYLKKFFQTLLITGKIQSAHEKSLQFAKKQCPKTYLCCCYHKNHQPGCKLIHKQNINVFFRYHYKIHHRQTQFKCCCQQNNKRNYNFQRIHDSEQIFQLLNQDKVCNIKFQVGDPVGDFDYLVGGFSNQYKILSNRVLLIQLLRTFQPSETILDTPNSNFILFNAYNQNCQDKDVFIPQIFSQLKKRKIFNKVYIQSTHDWEKLKFESNKPNTLYIIFGNMLTSTSIKKLNRLSVNVLLLTNKYLNLKQQLSIYGQSPIQPLTKYQCVYYFKIKKRESKSVKERILNFFQMTWKETFKYIYYPSNFDYNALMSIICEFGISSDNEKRQYQQFKSLIQKLDKEKLFFDYIFIMSVYLVAPENSKNKYKQLIKNFSFYIELQKNFQNNMDMQLFFKMNQKYYGVICQDLFDQIYKNLKQVLYVLVKQTYYRNQQSKFQNKKCIWLYQATTITKRSLISIIFEDKIKDLEQKQASISIDFNNFLKQCSTQLKLDAGLNIVKNILSFFYFFNTMTSKTQKEVSKIKIRMSQIQKEQQQSEQKQSNKLKLQVMFLCLMMINNAIIYRKSNKNMAKLQKDTKEITVKFQQKKKNQKIQEQRKQNLKKQFNWFESQQIYTQALAQILKFFVKQQKQKVYQEKDFIEKINCLSRKGLLYILEKSRKKFFQSQQLLAICDSLAIQLELQPGYSRDTNISQDNLKVLLCQMQQLVDNWKMSMKAKYRINFDILMALILVNTKNGRQKINQYLWQKINYHYKQFFSRQPLQIQSSNPLGEKDLSPCLQLLCSSEEMIQELKQYVRYSWSYQIQYFEQSHCQHFNQTIQLWNKYNQYSNNINNIDNCSTSFAKLLQLIQNVQYLKLYSQNTGQFHVYHLLSSLSSQMDRYMSELSKKMALILTNNILTKQNDICINRYIINFDHIIQKSDIDKNQLIIVYLNINQYFKKRVNIQCRYLVLNMSNLINFETLFPEFLQFIKTIKTQIIFLCQNIQNKFEKAVAANYRQAKCIISFNQQKENSQDEEEGLKDIKYLLFSFQIMKQMIQLKFQFTDQVLEILQFILKQSLQQINQNNDFNYEYNDGFNTYEKAFNKVKKYLKIQFQNSVKKVSQIGCLIYYKKRKSSQWQNKNVIQKNIKQNRQVPIKLKKSQSIILNPYLNIILQMKQIQQFKFDNNNIQKHISIVNQAIEWEILIDNYKIYLNQNKQKCYLFVLEDEEGKLSYNNIKKNQKPSKQKGIYQNLMELRDLMDNKLFLNAFHEEKDLYVIIKWYQNNIDRPWKQSIIKTLFSNSAQKQFQNYFIKIGNIPCLVSKIKGKKNIK